MPIVLRHHEQLELNRVEYHGSVSLAELLALAEFNAQDPVYLRRDCLSLVLPGADFATVDAAALDVLFERYRTLFAPLDFQIFRRAAWLCLSDAAREHVGYWLGGRDTREAMSSAVREFATFAEAGDWLLLNESELALLESGRGFDEVKRFEYAPVRAAAR